MSATLEGLRALKRRAWAEVERCDRELDADLGLLCSPAWVKGWGETLARWKSIYDEIKRREPLEGKTNA